MNAKYWKDLLSTRFNTPGTALLTKHVSQRTGGFIAAISFRYKISANMITVAGLALTLLACGMYTQAYSVGMLVLAGLIWQLAFAFDCADGQLARATSSASEYGKWLDMSCDHIREIALSYTVVYVLLVGGLDMHIALAAGALHASGALVYLYTCGPLRGHTDSNRPLGGKMELLRQMVRNYFDLPPFLLAITLLKFFPAMLALYVATYGAGQLLRGLALGNLRLKA